MKKNTQTLKWGGGGSWTTFDGFCVGLINIYGLFSVCLCIFWLRPCQFNLLVKRRMWEMSLFCVINFFLLTFKYFWLIIMYLIISTEKKIVKTLAIHLNRLRSFFTLFIVSYNHIAYCASFNYTHSSTKMRKR